MKRVAVILAGGVGSRFWPLSRAETPKHLLNLSGRDLLINETIDRLSGLVTKEDIFVVTNETQKDRIRSETAGRLHETNIIVEPEARNTAACIGLAAIKILSLYGDAVMCVLPADHHISNIDEFKRILALASDYATLNSDLVTIGIHPSFPATGYGYIRFNKDESNVFRRVTEFKEKPNRDTAKKYLLTGEYVWNSGMFVWKASTIIEEFSVYLPDIYADLKEIGDSVGTDKEVECIRAIYPTIRKISVDYGVLERSRRVVVISAKIGWNDVGSWDMIHVLHNRGINDNIIVGDGRCINTSNAVVYSTGRSISVIDMSDVIVVETADAVLVCRRSLAQNVRDVVEALKDEGRNDLL